jgi:hypothetical protein
LQQPAAEVSADRAGAEDEDAHVSQLRGVPPPA